MTRCSDVCDEIISRLKGLKFTLDDSDNHDDILKALTECDLIRSGARGPNLSDRELATVLAALRYWQSKLDEHLAPVDLDHFAEVDPLTSGEIDDLCERLNTREQETSRIRTIRVTMEGGVIHNIDHIPKGIRVWVMDFDVEGVDESELKTNKAGDRYCETIWER